MATELFSIQALDPSPTAKGRPVGPVQLSVIIPTFNRAHTLQRALHSALTQHASGIEVIVVDDGSTDDTRRVVEAMDNGNVQYFYQRNAGAPRARNVGIEAAAGKYVAFLDSDDVFLPNHLTDSLAVLGTRESVCVYAPVIVDRGSVRFLKPRLAYDNESPISEYLLCGGGFVQTSTLVLPRDLAQRVQYDEQLKFGQDVDYAIRLVASGARLVMLKQPGAVWHDAGNDGRISASIDVPNRIDWLKRIGPLLTNRALLADYGWHIAKAMARDGRLLTGLRHYFRAVFAGAYTPRLALAIFLQIVLPPQWYRQFADFLVRLGVRP